MGYKPVKNIALTIVLFLSGAGTVFAQNNMEAMRFLTVNALVQYGQKLYDRGDYNEATAVFDHVLNYDSHQIQALEYLKDMGHAPVPQLSKTLPQPVVPVQNVIVIRKSASQMVDRVDVADTSSLKEAIEAKKKSIEKLRSQIMQLRANLASQSAGESLN